MLKYPSIEQFRQVIRGVSHRARLIDIDQKGNPVYDSLKPLPVVEVSGTEKIHGSNGAVAYSKTLGFWVQSRRDIITPDKDNRGCAKLVDKYKQSWMELIDSLSKEHSIDLDKNVMTLYFEFAGDGVQRKSACSGLSKRIILFKSFRCTSLEEMKKDENRDSTWYDTKIKDYWVSNEDSMIFNIMNFKNYSFTIDFNNPEKSQNEMIAVMKKIEENSPVGKGMGKDGNIGEGIVCEFVFKGERFSWKVKGEKHSKTKIKKLNPVDMEKLSQIEKCVEQITHNWRFEQGLQEVFGLDYETNLSRTKLGEYLKWVAKDTLKEEMDIIKESGLEVKEVMKKAQLKAREYFFLIEQDLK